MKYLIVSALVVLLSLIISAPALPQTWTYSTNLGNNSSSRGLSTTAAGDAWVALGQSANGAIWHFDGSCWTRSTDLFPGASGSNYGIFALDPGHIWAGAHINSTNQGRIYFCDGSTWSLQTEIAGPNWGIYDLYAADQNNVWASGPSGHIYYTANGGVEWIIQTRIGSVYWFGIDGCGPGNVWAVGGEQPAQIAHYDGSNWTIETAFNTQTTGQPLRTVSAASPNAVWAAVEDGTILRRLSGGEWTVSTSLGKSGYNVADISVYNAVNVGLGMDGDASGIYHFDGSNWELQTDIFYVMNLDSSHGPRAWAGDDIGNLYFRDISGAPGYHTDYDGDGTSDIAIFRPSSGLWAVRGITRLYFGSLGDYPVPADYDGDSRTDPAIYRSWAGLWAVRGISRIYFGGGYDAARPADFDGDGTYGPSIFRSSTGLWAARGVTRVYYGASGDSALPGYYLGGPAMEIGLFRGNTGLWAIRGVTRLYFGGSTDTGKPGDYNGDGVWEPGIFRSSSGLWAIRGITRRYFGSTYDDPVPANYTGDNSDDIGIFRDSSGLWAIDGVSRIYFGSSDDTPVTR